MTEWTYKQLGEYADVQNGYAFKSSDFVNDGVPVIKIKNIVPPYVTNEDVQFVSEDLYNDKLSYALKYNDILISMTGSHVNQMASAVGKIGRIKYHGLSLLNQRVGKLYITNAEKLDYDYLYYFLSQEEIRYNLAASAGGSANQANISPSHIRKIEIPLPPLPTQRRIAAILSSLDDKIENNRKTAEKLEEIAQAIFKRWFVDFEFPNEDGEPYKSSGGKMVYCEEMGKDVPKGWRCDAFGSIIDITSGKRPGEKSKDKTSEFIYPLVGASSIMGYTSEFNYDEPILVIGRVGTHGIVQRYYRKVWISDNALVIKSNYFEFVNQILNSIDYNLMNRGSTQPLITQTDVKNTVTVIPRKEQLEKYENLVNSFARKISIYSKQNERLEQTRDALLPKLISGEIEV